MTVSPLAQFGVVYFDEIFAYATVGFASLTSGEAVTSVDRNGAHPGQAGPDRRLGLRALTPVARWDTATFVKAERPPRRRRLVDVRPVSLLSPLRFQGPRRVPVTPTEPPDGMPLWTVLLTDC